MVSGPLLLLIIALSIGLIILLSSVFRLHPFLSILLASIGVGLSVGIDLDTLVKTINTGFGNILGYIGLIVILGSLIGIVLEKTGATLRIAAIILNIVGPKRPTLAMSLIGAIVSIPVFCDSGFIILSGLNQAIAQQSKVAKSSLALALAAGLYTTHTLIPPTPGPIAAAGNIGAGDYLGLIIIIGLVTAIPVLILSYLYARNLGASIPTAAIQHQIKQENIPGAVQSLAPILVPIFLIAIASIVKFTGWESNLNSWLFFLGHPLIALLIGLGLSFSLMEKWDELHLHQWIGEGILVAGPILAITGAGGAFGGVLKATPLADWLGNLMQESNFSGIGVLVIAFGVSALLKTAQGSSTSALVITSAMLAPLLPDLGWESPMELALLVMAIGGGAMTVSHTNDSYFWVVSQFSGISLKDALRSYTVLTGLQGLSVLIMTILLFLLLV